MRGLLGECVQNIQIQVFIKSGFSLSGVEYSPRLND